MIKIINNGCLVALRGMETNSVDSIVTDPPYELGFMGKKWDNSGIAYSVEMWQECLRVLKPGGHLLAFGGTRTQHRMVCAIEDAGFEIRDTILWLYGSGFPKSLNISKQIDKEAGMERKVIGKRNDGRYSSMGTDIRSGNLVGGRPNSIEIGVITEPASELSKQYEGWGTALKPAVEMICMARKPISENTIVKNVLKWGTGGINIDGCRIGYNKGEIDFERTCKNTSNRGSVGNFGINKNEQELKLFNTQGRFPANVIHDGSEEVVSQFPYSTSGAMNGDYPNTIMKGLAGKRDGKLFHLEQSASSGSAARFFYCAKTSKSERNKGLDGFELKEGGMRSNTSGQHITRRDGGAPQPSANNHPTVKPIVLMRYLCRLVTPPKGIILDPFMGSGTTMIGAKIEGFSGIGIEREKDYCDIAQARIDAWKEEEIVVDLKLF